VNNEVKQPLNFTLTVMGKEGSISNPWIEIDGYFKLELPGEYEAGHSIVCDGTTLKIYNKKGEFIKEMALKLAIPSLQRGKHSIKFDCKFPAEAQLTNRLIIKTKSNPEITYAD
jgi:hypothetical protein